MIRRPALTLAGGDVRLLRRKPDGRVVAVYLDREGRPTAHTRIAWPHELRGVGWHLGEIKKLAATLPVEGAAAGPTEPAPARPLLFAHHVAAHLED
ncbi:MAG: hypothetical protein U1E23_14895 [Reyranellaceae bacterium]